MIKFEIRIYTHFKFEVSVNISIKLIIKWIRKENYDHEIKKLSKNKKKKKPKTKKVAELA
jgi:hypothetical protein